MTLTALVGALVALVARPKDEPDVEASRLRRQIQKLERELETFRVDYDALGRELTAERNLLTHWIGEASRFAREAREARERADLLRAIANGTQRYQPQQQLLAQCNNAQNQQQMMWRENYEGFCNCVPSRTQMFDVMVEQLNQLGR